MLTKHTYSVPILLIALTIPTSGSAEGGARIGLADARPALPASSIVPRTDFHLEVREAAQRIRARRRARLRRERRERFATLPAGVSTSTLEAIASCESGGNPTVVSSDGSYRGKYQFSFETWALVGGSGDPAAASEAEQDYRAALLYAQSGSSPWPVCG